MKIIEKFKPGDSVKLKSGGPDMTINEAIIKSGTDQFTGYYKCVWFAGKETKRDVFHENGLELVTEQE